MLSIAKTEMINKGMSTEHTITSSQNQPPKYCLNMGIVALVWLEKGLGAGLELKAGCGIPDSGTGAEEFVSWLSDLF